MIFLEYVGSRACLSADSPAAPAHRPERWGISARRTRTTPTRGRSFRFACPDPHGRHTRHTDPTAGTPPHGRNHRLRRTPAPARTLPRRENRRTGKRKNRTSLISRFGCRSMRSGRGKPFRRPVSTVPPSPPEHPPPLS